MKIVIENELVEFLPDAESERKDLSALWNVLVDCVKFNKKLVPVGEFIPGISDKARFAIEK